MLKRLDDVVDIVEMMRSSKVISNGQDRYEAFQADEKRLPKVSEEIDCTYEWV